MAQAAAKLKMPYTTFKRMALKFNCYKPNQGGKGTAKPSKIKIGLREILAGNHPEYSTYKLKNRLLKSGIMVNKCSRCGLTSWNGEVLNMELHHIDGNKFNHRLENLEMLCPNCHAQTDNYRAKNKKLSHLAEMQEREYRELR